MTRDRILTGLRANERLHLGNYLGAVLPIVELQKTHAGEYDIHLFVPDLHSITTPVDFTKLQDNIRNNLRYFAAAGLDFSDEQTFVYRQSKLPAHSELAWILSCFTYMGELKRMTQFKEKGGDTEQVSAALFTYPVLMAADILLYGAKFVPVGEDQRQHLELTRDLAIRLNNKFGDVFVVPEAWDDQLKFGHAGARIRSLSDPTKKMSKSVDDPRGTIQLDDNPDEAAKKVMSATTDSIGQINLDWEKQPGVSNLLQMLALLGGRTVDDVAKEWSGQSEYGPLKSAVAEAVKQFLSNFQQRLSSVDDDELMQYVTRGEVAVEAVANATLQRVQQAIGLG